MQPKTIDWKETGSRLEALRHGNLNLRRNVCKQLRYHLGNCAGDCKNCTSEMDNSISRNELSQVFLVSENTLTNWERGTTPVGVEDLLFYCELTGLSIEELLVFQS